MSKLRNSSCFVSTNNYLLHLHHVQVTDDGEGGDGAGAGAAELGAEEVGRVPLQE